MDLTRYEPLNAFQLFAFLKLDLPTDIKIKIYNEYFKIGLVCNKKYEILMMEIKSPKCTSLDPTDLKQIVELIFKNPEILSYVRAKNHLFNQIYIEHYIHNQKRFDLLNLFDSFNLTWLMHLYH